MDPKHSHGPDRVDYQETPGDLTEVHASLLREHPEPTAEVTPIPMWLTVLCLVAFCWAGLYLGLFNGGLRGDVFNELSSNAGMLFPAPGKGGPAGPIGPTDPKLQGQKDYASVCQACHQPTGGGMPGTVPPLAGSQYVQGSEKRLAAIMLKGLKGPVTVHGISINSQMQAWEGQMGDKKLASIATYIRSSFGNTAPPVTEAQFAAARKEFAPHKDQMTEPEILAIPEDATLPGGDAGGNSAVPANSTGERPGTPPGDKSGDKGIPPGGNVPLPVTAPGSPTGPAVIKPSPDKPGVTVPSNAAPAAPPAPATPEQLAAGKTLYMTICVACHQISGAGLFPLAPPLIKSPYVNGSPERFVAIILKGNNPPFTIEGKLYAAVPMPPQEAMLDDEKIAAVATYVRGSFENTAGPVTKEQVAATRAKFADRKTAWTQPELDAWKD